MVWPLLFLAAAAVIEVPAGGSAHDAIARAKRGDEVHLAAGTFPGSLGRPAGIAIAGAGSTETIVEAAEGEDGAVLTGARVELRGLTLRAGPTRAALKVEGGEAALADVLLSGGA